MTATPDSTPRRRAGPSDDEVTTPTPAFAPTKRRRADPPMPGAKTTTTPATDPPLYRPDDDFDDQLDARATPEWSEPTVPKPPESSSRASTEPNLEIQGLFADLASLVVLLATRGLARVMRSGAFIATEDESAAIAAPVGRIAERHAPVDDDTVPDVVDAWSAGVHTVKYGIRAVDDHLERNLPVSEGADVDE